ncbi:glycosyltransferase family 2 protein [Chloroflexota bacterium]
MLDPLVSVIIVNWNGCHHLDVCISSLLAQTHQNYEIFLIDNGSKDGSVEHTKKHYPSVRITSLPENLGFCEANNIGIKQANGEYIALINNDTEADQYWLSESIGALESHPEAGFIASRIRLFFQRKYIDTTGDILFRTGYPGKRGWLLLDGPEYEKNKWVFGACAGASVYRRSMLNEIGLFDPDFFSFMEDIEISFRAHLYGYRCLYVASAIVYHKVGSTANLESPQRQFWSHRNHWYNLIKNLPALLWAKYFFQILGAELFVFGSAIKNQRTNVFFNARIEVLKNLSKMLQKRKRIQKERKVPIQYINSMLQSGWFSLRIKEKKQDFVSLSNSEKL